ncbi:MAG: hypothetical protein A2Y40_04735 [Candidatus Margulisbacteria bacterium GWF2_35_9]|nr:MAG: hypothetical protein A2Y40_04735 [Candidatus Margulisbacteria bacterium GWF2_35_9]
MVNEKIYIEYDIAAVDVGNSYVSTAYFRLGQLVLIKKVRTSFVRSKISINKSKTIIVSSVVPRITDIINRLYPKARIVNLSRIPIKELPSHLGTDRAINMYSAMSLYKITDVMLIDFGTALTFSCCINKKFIGGLIMPGLRLMQEALGKTAKLPVVRDVKRSGVLQMSTEDAIKSGIYTALCSTVSSTISQIQKEIGKDLLVVATGGDSLVLGENIEGIKIINPTLIHEGLALLANSQ